MISDVILLDTILKGITGNPAAVSIKRTTDELGVLLTVSVAREDMGRVIGKEGSTAKAIRLILNSHGFSAKERVNMKILEPN